MTNRNDIARLPLVSKKTFAARLSCSVVTVTASVCHRGATSNKKGGRCRAARWLRRNLLYLVIEAPDANYS
jgi:hypothetical protein